MYIEHGTTNLWGTIDTDKFTYYFDSKYPKPAASNPTVWKPTKRQASELPADFPLRVQVTTYHTGSQINTYQKRTKANSNFLLVGAYPNANGSSHVFTYPERNSGTYRAMRHYRYIVKGEGSSPKTYWLREPYFKSDAYDIKVIEEKAPANWGK